MHRRDFICQVTAASTASASLSSAAQAKENRSVTYKVQGFTCVTCAVGLEVMLRREKGVTRADASYKENKVVIGFDADLTSEKALKSFIVECGFSVAS
jgi:copper chaperone CopZ